MVTLQLAFLSQVFLILLVLFPSFYSHFSFPHLQWDLSIDSFLYICNITLWLILLFTELVVYFTSLPCSYFLIICNLYPVPPLPHFPQYLQYLTCTNKYSFLILASHWLIYKINGVDHAPLPVVTTLPWIF